MLPNSYLKRMKDLLADEFDPFFASYQELPAIGLRVNTLKINPETFSKISPYPLTPLPWTTVGFTLPPDCRPGTHPYHAAGLYYLQDPAAMAVAEQLDPQPGDRILDIAAAPGGKATHIAARMAQQGLLVANDINPARVKRLYNNLERWGARNTVVLNETPQRLAAHFGPFFDRVLVDAPCSGEGMFRKDSAAVYDWNPRVVASCASRQDRILQSAARLVRPGGRLVYATCTFAPQENEGTVLRFLKSHPGFDLEEPVTVEGFSPGRPDWLSVEDLSGRVLDPVILSRTVRLWPHLAPGEGHFIATLHKKMAETGDQPSLKPYLTSPVPPNILGDYISFAEKTMQWDFSLPDLSLHGTYLYHIPKATPNLHGLKVVHWGWWLGTFKTNRFEPSQALVMALTPDDLRQVCDWPVDDPRLGSYLRGEVLSQAGPDGWIMVAVDGYPLGWAKRVQDRLKPRFPRWLRLAGEMG